MTTLDTYRTQPPAGEPPRLSLDAGWMIAPLALLVGICGARVGVAVAQGGPFGAEPSLALLLGLLGLRLLRDDLVAHRRWRRQAGAIGSDRVNTAP